MVCYKYGQQGELAEGCGLTRYSRDDYRAWGGGELGVVVNLGNLSGAFQS